MGRIGSKFHTPAKVMLAAQLAFASLVMQTTSVRAQLVPSVNGASTPEEDGMERAKRQADNVMRWIKVHAEKPRAAPAAPAPAPAPAPVAKQTAPKPAPAPRPAPEPVAPEPQKAEIAAPPPVEVPVAAPVVVPAPVIAAPPAAPVKAPEPPPQEEEEEVPLKAISQAQPTIPRNVLTALNAGKVMVRFTVEPNGSTSNVEVLSSSSRRLNSPTISAVSGWKFEPIKTARTAQVEFDFLAQ